jgi:hypothetical protein
MGFNLDRALGDCSRQLKLLKFQPSGAARTIRRQRFRKRTLAMLDASRTSVRCLFGRRNAAAVSRGRFANWGWPSRGARGRHYDWSAATLMPKDSIQQEVAVRDADARQLVLAGPGTGKTETVALRISRLLTAGVGPAQILVLSFSRSAVRTVAERLERHADHSIGVLEDLRYVSIRTFDSWSFRLLRQLGELPEDLLALSYDGTVNRLTEAMTGEQREEIRERLGRIRHIIVDEFQDLAGVRGRLVLALLDLLAPPKDDRVGFTILGDEAQAIYGFALRSQIDQGLPGLATTELLDALRERYGAGLTETELETNHRAVPGLANLALMLRRILRWAHSPTTKLEVLRALQHAVPESDVVPRELAATLADGVSMAILTRSNGEALRVWQQVMGARTDGGCIGVMNLNESMMRREVGVSRFRPPPMETLIDNLLERVDAPYQAGIEIDD